MCDTSKNHVLDALSTSENRMIKFLPVQKLVGGSTSPPWALTLRFYVGQHRVKQRVEEKAAEKQACDGTANQYMQ